MNLPVATPAATTSAVSAASRAAVASWLGARARHAAPRLVSVLVSSVAALSLAPVVPAPWGLLVLFGGPVAAIVVSAQAVTLLWVRQGRALGLDDDTIRAIRTELRALPPRVPFYDGDELLTLLEARVPALRALEPHRG